MSDKLASKSTAIEDLAAGLGEELVRIRELYFQALTCSNSDNPMKRLLQLFDAETYGTDGLTVEPYEQFVPGVWVGCEKTEDTRLQISSLETQTLGSDACDISISRVSDSTTRWFTLEIEVPLHLARASRNVSVSLFGSVDSGTTNLDMHLSLFVFDVGNERHDIAYTPFATPLQHKLSQGRCDGRVTLPSDLRLDDARPAVLAIFFPPTAQQITLSDLHMGLN